MAASPTGPKNAPRKSQSGSAPVTDKLQALTQKWAQKLVFVAMAAGLAWIMWHQHQAQIDRTNEASTRVRFILASQEAHTGIMEVSPTSGNIIFADAAACHVFNYKPDELEDKPLAVILPIWLHDYHASHLKMAMDAVKKDPKAPKIKAMKCMAVGGDGKDVEVVIRVFISPSQDTMFVAVNKAEDVIWTIPGPPEQYAPPTPKALP